MGSTEAEGKTFFTVRGKARVRLWNTELTYVATVIEEVGNPSHSIGICHGEDGSLLVLDRLVGKKGSCIGSIELGIGKYLCPDEDGMSACLCTETTIRALPPNHVAYKAYKFARLNL
jgi:hypothetical protein